MQEKTKILFIGDIVGKSGRIAVEKFLQQITKSDYDFIIANGENASHGFGLTKKNHDELLSFGINCITSGNHIWDKKDVLTYINESRILIRPYNYHASVCGVGYKIFDNIIVANLLGKTFMPPIECPFISLKKMIEEIEQQTTIEDKIFIIDFHAEATAEKVCFANYALNLGVKAVVGTHTHIPTADERIIKEKCAYITDVGFCGSQNGVIGMEYEASYKRLLTSISEKFEVEASYPYIVNACEIEFNSSTPINIKRIKFEHTQDEDDQSEN